MKKKNLIFLVVIIILVLMTGGIFLSIETQNEKETIQKQETDKEVGIDTSNWSTYRSEEYGLEFKYPPNGFIREKIIERSEITNSPIPILYIADEFERKDVTASEDDIIFHSINLQFSSAVVRIIPKIFIADKDIHSITCPYNSVKPCFEKNYLEEFRVDSHSSYIKKNPFNITVCLKDVPKKWSDYNMIDFDNMGSGNQSTEENVEIMKIFEEVLSSIRFLE